jgi:hypothetical protein
MTSLNLMALSPRLKEKVSPFFSEILEKYDANIHSLYLVGSVLTEDYIEKVSDINSIIVLKEMDLNFLDILAPMGKKHHQPQQRPHQGAGAAHQVIGIGEDVQALAQPAGAFLPRRRGLEGKELARQELELQQQVEVHQHHDKGRTGVKPHQGDVHIHHRQPDPFAYQQVEVRGAEDDGQHVGADCHEGEMEPGDAFGGAIGRVQQRLGLRLPWPGSGLRLVGCLFRQGDVPSDSAQPSHPRVGWGYKVQRECRLYRTMESIL